MPSVRRHLLAPFRPALISLLCGLLVAGCASRDERIRRAIGKAETALLEDDAPRAVEILSKAAEKYANSPEVHQELGDALVVVGEAAQAAEAYRQAIELDRERSELWVKIADQRMSLGQNREAIEAFKAYLNAHPNDFLAWKNLSQLYTDLGRYLEALKAADEWNNLRPSPSSQLQMGRLSFLNNNVAQARLWYGQAIEKPSHPAAREALIELIDVELSLQQYSAVEELIARYDQTYGEPSTKVQLAKAAITKWRKTQEEIAQAARELEEERRALEAQQAAARQREEELRRARERGLAGTGGNGTGRASPRETPRPPEAQAEREATAGAARPSEGRAPAASSEALPQLAQARQAAEQGRYREAIDLYWEVLGQNAENARVWHELARAYMEVESWYDAEACILEAKRRDPRSEQIAATYLAIIGRTQGADRVLSEAASLRQLFPRSETVALAMARALRETEAGRGAARQAYEAFLRLSGPGAPGYDEARDFLNTRF